MGEYTPNLDLYTASGTVHLDKLYATRRTDAELLDLCVRGEFAYLLTSRQMGKSSLVVRTSRDLRLGGIKSAQLDLQSLTEENLSPEAFYLGLIAAIEDELGVDTGHQDWWKRHDKLGPLNKFTRYFSDLLLSHLNQRVVIFLDEIETTLKLPYKNDFFGALRYLFNERANNSQLERLSFIIIGSAKSGDLITDSKLTPFNIGLRLELADFTFDEALPLTAGMGMPEQESRDLLRWILKWTGGHPYLTQRLIIGAIRQTRVSVWTEVDVNQLVHETFLGTGNSQDDNLAHTGRMLTSSGFAPNFPSELRLYKRIHYLKNVADEDTSQDKNHLKLSGIVRRQDGALRISNRIYESVFNADWVSQHNPADWKRRFRFSLVGFALMIILLPALILYLKNKELEFSLIREKAATERAERLSQQLRNALDSESSSRRDAESQKVIANEQRALAVEEAQGKERERALAETKKKEAEDLRQVAEKERQKAQRLEQIAQARKQVATAHHLQSQAHRALQENNFTAAQVLYALASNLDDTIDLRNGYSEAKRKSHLKLLWVKSSAELLPAFASDPTSNFIALGTAQNKISLLDSVSGREIGGLDGHNGRVFALAFSLSGKYLASGALDATVTIWDTVTRKPVHSLFLGEVKNGEATFASDNLPKHLTFSPDEQVVIITLTSGAIVRWSFYDKTTSIVGLSWKDSLNPVAYSSDGVLASIDTDGEIMLSYEENGQKKARYLKPPLHATSLLSAPGNKLISSGDKFVTVWDLSTGKEARRLTASALPIEAISLHHDEKTLAVADNSRSVRIWDLQTAMEKETLRGFPSLVMRVAFTSKGQLITQMLDGSLACWAYQEETGDHAVFEGHKQAVWSMSFSPDGRFLATGSLDHSANLWDTKTRKSVRNWKRGESAYPYVTFSNDGRLLYLGGIDASIYLFDLYNNTEITLELPDTKQGAEDGEDEPLAATFHPDGNTLAVAYGNKIRLWNIPTRTSICTYQASNNITRLAISPDGTSLAAITDNSLILWKNISTSCKGTQFNWIQEGLTSVVFTPDSRKVITGNKVGTIDFWDIARERNYRTVYGRLEPSVGVSLSHDSKLLAWGTGGTQKIVIMDFVAARQLAEVQGFRSPIILLTFSPDGRWLAASDLEGKVHLINLESLLKDYNSDTASLLREASSLTNLKPYVFPEPEGRPFSRQELNKILGEELDSFLMLDSASSDKNSANLRLTVFARYTTFLQTTCSNPPIKAELNTLPSTFGSTAEMCSGFPALELAKVGTGHPTTEAEWKKGIDAKDGDTINALVYISNVAANRPVLPEAIAKNVRLKIVVDELVGASHTVSVSFRGDNTNTVLESLPVRTNENVYLEIVPESFALYDYQGRSVKKLPKLINNAETSLGDLLPGFTTDLQIRFLIKVKKKSLH